MRTFTKDCDLCCSLEQAKHLKKLGIEQKSKYYWKVNNEQNVIIANDYKPLYEKHFSFNKFYSAFTPMELVDIIVKLKIK